MTTTVLPAAPRCARCDGPAVTDGTTVRHAHTTWCPYATAATPSRLRDPYAVPGTQCFRCGHLTRGGPWCGDCRRTVINGIKENS